MRAGPPRRRGARRVPLRQCRRADHGAAQEWQPRPRRQRYLPPGSDGRQALLRRALSACESAAAVRAALRRCGSAPSVDNWCWAAAVAAEPVSKDGGAAEAAAREEVLALARQGAAEAAGGPDRIPPQPLAQLLWAHGAARLPSELFALVDAAHCAAQLRLRHQADVLWAAAEARAEAAPLHQGFAAAWGAETYEAFDNRDLLAVLWSGAAGDVANCPTAGPAGAQIRRRGMRGYSSRGVALAAWAAAAAGEGMRGVYCCAAEELCRKPMAPTLDPQSAAALVWAIVRMAVPSHLRPLLGQLAADAQRAGAGAFTPAAACTLADALSCARCGAGFVHSASRAVLRHRYTPLELEVLSSARQRLGGGAASEQPARGTFAPSMWVSQAEPEMLGRGPAGAGPAAGGGDSAAGELGGALRDYDG
eukprot:TRINITY_DN28964_c0_g1_i1.p1 TRINITY_DN28964_c0_g1~~TRINITY_DN28964_c0_g1_i1.p1  ORF type:complete len:432 (+),score=100.48 TRINITY_DN28964_c0_g1_i1:34-1296(+)